MTTNFSSPSGIIPKPSKTSKSKKSKSAKLPPQISDELKRDIEYYLKMVPDCDKRDIYPSLDRIAVLLEHQIGEWLQNFVVLGFTHDGKLLKLFHTPTCVDVAAIDTILNQSAIEQQTINNIIIKQNVSDFFNTSLQDDSNE